MEKRVLVIGLGRRGQFWASQMAQNWQHEGWVVAGAVEPRMEAIGEAVQKGILPLEACFQQLDDAMAAIHPHAAIITTPPTGRPAVVLRLLQAGIHVMVEKPFADKLEDARLMVDTAEKFGATLMVAQNYRFRPEARLMRQCLREGTQGEPGFVTLTCHKYLPRDVELGSYRLTMAYPTLFDASIHHFDTLRAVLGRDAVAVTARRVNPSWSWYPSGDGAIHALIEMEGGLLVNYCGSLLATGVETPFDGAWRIECADGAIHRNEAGLGDGVFLTSVRGATSERLSTSTTTTGEKALLDELKGVLEATKTPETSGRDNLNTLAIVFGAVRSIEEGVRIQLSELPQFTRGTEVLPSSRPRNVIPNNA